LVTATTGSGGEFGQRWRHMSEETAACSLLTPLVEDERRMASAVRLKLPSCTPRVRAASGSQPTSIVHGPR
jgi:hypothetical protein